MQESTYKSFEELPLFLNAKTVGEVLGISPELLHQEGFSPLKNGKYVSRIKEVCCQGRIPPITKPDNAGLKPFLGTLKFEKTVC